MDAEHQRDIDGLLCLWWALPDVGDRWTRESRALALGPLTVSHFGPFLKARERYRCLSEGQRMRARAPGRTFSVVVVSWSSSRSSTTSPVRL